MSLNTKETSPRNLGIAGSDLAKPTRLKRKFASLDSPEADCDVPYIKADTPLTFRVTFSTSPIPSDPGMDLRNTALEFEEFSFLTEDRRIATVPEQCRKDFHDYLKRYYNARCVDYAHPYIIVHYEEDPLNDLELFHPYSIADLIAIWTPLDEGERREIFTNLGYESLGEIAEIPDEALQDIEENGIPSESTILTLADNLFPGCLAISFIWDTIVVEYPKRSYEEFSEQLLVLPRNIEGSMIMLEYCNGPLASCECAETDDHPNEAPEREIKPLPDRKVPVHDHTDYLERDGKFYPGSMICSLTKTNEIQSMVTAGILIRKDGIERLTCSYHCWKPQDKENPGLLGSDDIPAQEIFQVVQGSTPDEQPGTRVGWIRERIGDTDIALAELHEDVVFENQFFKNRKVQPKVLLPTSKINIGDWILAENFVAGWQRFTCAGVRFELEPTKNRRSLREIPDQGPKPNDNERYIKIKQCVLAGNKISPCTPEGTYGSVLIRSKDAKLGRQIILDQGQVCGILHLSGIRELYSGLTMLYADSFDRLIERGWEVSTGGDAKTDASPSDSSESEDSDDLKSDAQTQHSPKKPKIG
ncbi:hypothetical protein AA313_de0204878 [Arthrobotrys entomopaga]|nr:hypothetical protein AA313_de0204878 [Arthrobotrys entomopaga]